MSNSKIIRQLEKQLNTPFKNVDIFEITKFKYLPTYAYSTDQDGNIVGLCISNVDLKEIPPIITEFHSLSKLDMGRNKITDISVLKNLNELIELHLTYNNISDIAPLKDLKGLTDLQLNNNQISDISALSYLIGLKKLGLSFNKISNISDLKELIELTKLSIGGNKFSDISMLKDFKCLTELHLQSTLISDISSLKGLVNLTILGLAGNQISDISALKELKGLIELNLSSNQISDISALKNIKGLSKLYITDNLISDVSAFQELKKLKLLYIINNPIKNLPAWICDFPEMNIEWAPTGREGFITFYENPLEYPPIEIIKQGKEALKRYFELLERENLLQLKPQYIFETKLLIIGEGGTGKTSLFRKLKNENADLPDEKDTTIGVDIEKWIFPINKDLFRYLPELSQTEMYINCWDFGGQKIYHGTHQIFFGEQSFYILVAETREQKTDFNYWFNTIEQLAGDNVSLLLVINKKFGHVLNFDKDGLSSRFNFIKSVIEIDLLKDTTEIIELQNVVKNRLQEMKHIGKPLSVTFIKIREHLQAIKEHFIGLDQFIKICEQHQLTDYDDIVNLSKYFTEIGAITHFVDDDILKHRVFLNSNWLVKTIYKVLENLIIVGKNGRICHQDVCDIWNAEKLEFEISNLTQVMHRFGLMYKVRNKNEYVIPAHLPNEKPYKHWTHLNSDKLLLFKYVFDKYMPEGLMSHLIVSLHNYIEKEIVWQKGVNICFENTFAEIIEPYSGTNTFEIKIAGSQKRELLAIIRERFSEILKPFKKLDCTELVPCNCSKCKNLDEPFFYSFGVLNEFITERVYEILCLKSKISVNIQGLLAEIILENELENCLIKEDFDTFFSIIKSKLTKMPYTIDKKKLEEGDFHRMFHLILQENNISVQSEDTTNNGRIDSVVKIGKTIFIFEFKINSTATEALKQIKNKEYFQKFSYDYDKIWATGVNFKERTVEKWEVEKIK